MVFHTTDHGSNPCGGATEEVTKMNWISVNDYLPVEDQDVLVFIEYEVDMNDRHGQPKMMETFRCIEMGIFEIVYGYGDDPDFPRWHISRYSIRDYKVLYWMPLPKEPDMK